MAAGGRQPGKERRWVQLPCRRGRRCGGVGVVSMSSVPRHVVGGGMGRGDGLVIKARLETTV